MIKKLWDNLEENILIASYLVIIPVLFMQVVMRYIFNNSLTWSEELARYIFIWQVWLGSSYAVQKSRHIRIDVFTARLPRKVQRFWEVAITLICIVFCSFLCYKGFGTMSLVARLHQTSPAIKIPMQFVYACIPVSTFLMVIRYIESLVRLFRAGPAAAEEEA